MAFTEEQIDAACKANGWKRTGVFATPDEVSMSKEWQREMASTPMAKVHGHWLNDDADALFKRRIDELAKHHGLPDLAPVDGEPDHYGLIATGEFTTLAR